MFNNDTNYATSFNGTGVNKILRSGHRNDTGQINLTENQNKDNFNFTSAGDDMPFNSIFSHKSSINKMKQIHNKNNSTIFVKSQDKKLGYIVNKMRRMTVINSRKENLFLSVNLPTGNFGGILLSVLVVLSSLCTPSFAFCPSGCMCDNVELAVQCVSGRMDVVPILLNPATIRLDLSHNRIKTILPGFAFYHELQVLNVSYNEIVSLGESNFGSQIALQTLIIRKNKISKLENRAFIGLSSLIHLDANNNYIESIHSATFEHISRLQKLDLSANRIKFLPHNLFHNLTSLKTLDLCQNLLTDIPENIFESLSQLEHLLLCSNEIQIIEDNNFRNLRRLSFLSFQGNQIKNISNKAFVGLENLSHLTLHGNSLLAIPTTQMVSIANLEELNLSLNFIGAISANSFNPINKLKRLSISQCSNLSSIDQKAFETLNRLTSLELNFNPVLVDFDVEVLRPLSELRRLILRGNGIKTIAHTLLSIGRLQYIDLRDNEFDCACSLKWLQQASVNKSLGLVIEDVLCSSPEALKGRDISSMTDYDLECYSHLITVAICAACFLTMLFSLGIAFIIYYKNCRKVKTLVHDNWPDKIVTTWRETDYQKQVEDDEYTFHSLRGIHHIPVTVI